MEPPRNNLLKVMSKNFLAVNRTTYFHRIIFIGKDPLGHLQSIIESVAKEFSDEQKGTDFLTGLGLFYNPYVVNIIESTEDAIMKFFQRIVAERQLQPSGSELKILLFLSNISQTHFPTWTGIVVRPPVSLKNIPASSDKEHNLEMMKLCISKLNKIMSFINSQPATQYHTTLQNLPQACQQYIPETALIDFLIVSPMLISIYKYLDYAVVAPWKSIEELVWPMPPSYVPYNVIHEGNE